MKTNNKNKKKITFGSVLKRITVLFLEVIFTLILIGLIAGTIVGITFALYIRDNIDASVDMIDDFATEQNLTTKFYYMDYTDRQNRKGEAVEYKSLYGSENRVWVSFTDIPVYLYEAFIAIEDERFWDHQGVDWKRTLGAVYHFFLGGDDYGGSTITQQFIKNLTGENEVRIQRKVQEILRALNLEKVRDKTEILELYLNTINFSRGCYGVQTAAQEYFGKELSELTLIECAALAAIPNAPTAYDPIRNPENNAYRRDLVLEKMLELEKITQEEYDTAYGKELIIEKAGTEDGEEITDDTMILSWYEEEAIRQVVNDLMEQYNMPENLAVQKVYSGGLQIQLLMDPEVQETLERIYENPDSFPKLKGVIQPQSAMVIIDPETGDVLGLVGSRGKKTANRILNYATVTTRSPGSSIKPVAVYGPALDANIITYASVYDDVPVNFDDYTYDPETGVIVYEYKETGTVVTRTNSGWPSNLPVIYNGLTNVNSAIERSVNTVAVRVLQDLTVEKSFDFVKNKLNMHSLIESKAVTGGQILTDKGLAALALGEMNYGVTVMEITAAYSIFANEGVYNAPRVYANVYDSEGSLLLTKETDSRIVISEESDSIMTKMMQNVMNNGTGRSVTLRNTVDVAGKTGTTTNDNDRWFVGYTPYFIGGVWFGYSEPKSLSALTTNPTNAIWDTVMTELHKKYIDEANNGGAPLKTFQTASGVIEATFCKDSGLLMTDACRADPRGNRAEKGYFTKETAPQTYCDTHVMVNYDKETQAIACPDCPRANIVQVGLLNVTTRNFPISIAVTDAQYTYRALSPSVEPGGWYGVPFYINMLGGKYPGFTNVERQYNHYCYTHYVPTARPETTEDVDETEETNPSDSPIAPDPDTGFED